MLWKKEKVDQVRRTGAGAGCRFKWSGLGGLMKKVTFEHGVKELWELATSCLEQEYSRWKQRWAQRPWVRSYAH